MRSITRLLSLAVLVAVAACDEAAGPAPPGAQDLDVVVPALVAGVEPIPIEAPAIGDDVGEDVEPPDEFDREPALLTSRLDVGFTSTRAYGQAMMRFWGNRGRQEVTLDLWSGTSKIASRMATGRKSELLPGVYRIDTTASIATTKKCGLIADGTSHHEATHQYGSWEWDTDSQQNHDDDALPDCVDEVDESRVEGDGNNEDSEWVICYYTHYYDATTGRYLYTEFHGCEPL